MRHFLHGLAHAGFSKPQLDDVDARIVDITSMFNWMVTFRAFDPADRLNNKCLPMAHLLVRVDAPLRLQND
jgi:hypothetical protein